MNVIHRIEKYKQSNSIRKRESAEFEMKGLKFLYMNIILVFGNLEKEWLKD